MFDVQIFESNGTRRTLIDTIHNNPDSDVTAFAAAKARVATMGVAFMEDDVDYIDCADAFMNDGRILCIQPVGFTLTGPAFRRDAAKAHAATMQAAAAAFDAEFLSKPAENDADGTCIHCGRDNTGHEGKPCSDDCPLYWEMEGKESPE